MVVGVSIISVTVGSVSGCLSDFESFPALSSELS